MRQTPGTALGEIEPPIAELRLLVEPEPWSRVFAQNLRAFFQRPKVFNQQSTIASQQSSATFWPDVFVERGLPWRRFWQSGACHVLALAMIWAGSRLFALQPHVASQPAFTHADVVYYTPSEYLPPLDTRRSHSVRTRKADPEYSAQPIISVPREADNRSQTIVTPPDIQLQHDVPLPNIVAWRETPQVPIGPAPAVPASENSRLAPQMERSVIAPPPDLQPASQKSLHAPEPAVIAPPPAVEAGSIRRLGDLNIAHSSVIAPAPQPSLEEQRAVPGRSSIALSRRSPEVIAPPPSLAASGRSGGGVIALSLHPAVGAPPDPPAGNRRGNFAATPEGHRGASGAPGASAGNGKENATGSGKKSSGDLPSGLYVGKTSNATSPVAGNPASNSTADTVNPNLLANARPPRVSTRMRPEGEGKLSDEERAVFGTRKFYSLSLNMPNLNSAGGSWIVRFAALKPDAGLGHPSSGGPSSGDRSSGDRSSGDRSSGDRSSGDPTSENLSAPSATRKVDPAYPQELMRQNVGGTVILYAVIHADGKVGSVRVLRSVDDRIDQFASEAIAKWQFQPATKNGTPVDVEATFSIPFRPARVGSSF
jgi:TonB family protein